MAAKRFACPCCEQLTLSERGAYDICQECGWEDDPADEGSPWSVSGPNGNESLWEAQLRVMQPPLTTRERKVALAELRAIEAAQRLPGHLEALGRALRVDLGEGSMVSAEEADALSLRLWNGPRPGGESRWVPDKTGVDRVLAGVARRTPRDLDVIALHILYDALFGAPRVPAIAVVEQRRPLLETTRMISVCTKSLRTGLVVMAMNGGYDIEGWGALAT